MKNTAIPTNLVDAINHYYQYNPDTLLPLLMVALAAHQKLFISDKKGKDSFACIKPEEVYNYDWVRLDSRLRDKMCDYIGCKRDYISVNGSMDGSVKEIYKIFYHYDTFTVDQEFHHRLGILYQHSSKEPSDQAHRQYATICLAKELINTPLEILQEKFLSIANRILVKSGLQPQRPRIEVAKALCHLLQYDGEGSVYYPFAGCGLAGALIKAGENLYADGDVNPKLLAAAKVLIYGMGGSTEHVKQHDSTKWLDDHPWDYVLSTYRGYIKGKSAFDFCLGKCFQTFSPKGKFAGIIAPKDIFEHQSEELKEAVRKDWVETIALLPFGEVAILINADKPKILKNKVQFYNMHSSLLCNKSIVGTLSDEKNAHVYAASSILEENFLRNLIVQDPPEKPGNKLVRLGDFVNVLPRRSYVLSNLPDSECILASIDRSKSYDPFDNLTMTHVKKRKISSLFGPAYQLTTHCILTNTNANLEPRVYDVSQGGAFFQDGYAFELKENVDSSDVILMLQQPIVNQQLHPYGADPLLPEPITEEEILNLQFYVPEDQAIVNDNKQLQPGFKLYNANQVFTIHKFLDKGGYGYTYTAEEEDLTTGWHEEVVIKEYFPDNCCYREEHKVKLKAEASEEERSDFEKGLKHFISEAEIMKLLGSIPDSHIAPAYCNFHSTETDTDYYVMPYYETGSIFDALNKQERYSETVIINQIVKPLCKALHTAHAHHILHLDVKLDNMMIDEDGNAVLIDFGMANRYDENGMIIHKSDKRQSSEYLAPELRNGYLSKFAPQTDVYGLASALYQCVTYKSAEPIYSYSVETNKKLSQEMRRAFCSTQFIQAVLNGLYASPENRPDTMEKFLRLFPNCENEILE